MVRGSALAMPWRWSVPPLDLPHRHQHAPVDAAELVGAARAALVIVLEEGVAVDHQHPGPAVKCQARIADASGSQAVPEPMRVMGIPNGRSGIAGVGLGPCPT